MKKVFRLILFVFIFSSMFYVLCSMTNAVSDSVNINQEVVTEKIAPKNPFLVLNVVVSDITSESATVTWETDKAVTTNLKYDREENKYKLGGIYNIDFKNYHKVVLTELSPEIIYYFKIWAKDKDGNEVISEEYNFATVPLYTFPFWQRLSKTVQIIIIITLIILLVVIWFLLWRARKR